MSIRPPSISNPITAIAIMAMLVATGPNNTASIQRTAVKSEL